MQPSFRGFAIEGEVGRGGFARVYRGRDISSGLPVAVKIPHVKLEQTKYEGCLLASAEDVKSVAQVLVECRQWASCPEHPYLAAFQCLQQDGPHIGIVGEWVEGEPLADLLISGYHRLTRPFGRGRSRFAGWMRPAVLGLQVLEGLQVLHKAGVLHLDLTPRNVLVGNAVKQIKVIDFGLSEPAVIGGLPSCVVRGWTPAYAAPEVFSQGSPVTDRADIFSWGLIMVAMASMQAAQELVSSERSDGGENNRERENLAARAQGRQKQFSEGDGAEAMRLRWPDASIRDLILACLEPEAKDRPSAADAVRIVRKAMKEAGHEPRPGIVPTPPNLGLVKLFNRLSDADGKLREAVGAILSTGVPTSNLVEGVIQKIALHAELGNLGGCKNLLPLLREALAIVLEEGLDERVVMPEDHLVVELAVDPALDLVLDVAEVDHHVPRVEIVGPDLDLGDRVVPVGMLADPVVVEQAVPVAEFDALGDEVHGACP